MNDVNGKNPDRWEKWEKARERGMGHYVLVLGSVYMVGCILGMVLARWHLGHHGLALIDPWTLGGSLAGSVTLGIIMWYSSESRFRKHRALLESAGKGSA